MSVSALYCSSIERTCVRARERHRRIESVQTVQPNKKHISIYGNVCAYEFTITGKLCLIFKEYNRLNVRALLKRNTPECVCARARAHNAHSPCETCVQAMRKSYYLIHRSENHFNLNREKKDRESKRNKIRQRKNKMLTLIAGRM